MKAKTANSLVGVLVLAATVAGTVPAFADEGLPQLDASLFPEQLFWLAVSFGTLYLLMHFVALPGVQKVQDKRKGILDTELSAARTANDQARNMGHEADRALTTARSKANATIAEIKAQASKTATEQQAAQAKQLNQKMRDAEANISAAREKALKEIEATASDLAEAIVDTVSGQKVRA